MRYSRVLHHQKWTRTYLSLKITASPLSSHVQKTGVFLRVPPSYDAGAFCLGPCEKRMGYGKPVISSPTIPRERGPSLSCTTLLGGASRIRRRRYVIVADRSRRCQADRRRGEMLCETEHAIKPKERAYGSGRHLCCLRSDQCARGDG